MLLAKGANVNARGGYYGNAPTAALAHSHDKVVQMLLAKVAGITAKNERYPSRNALEAASSEGH